MIGWRVCKGEMAPSIEIKRETERCIVKGFENEKIAGWTLQFPADHLFPKLLHCAPTIHIFPKMFLISDTLVRHRNTSVNRPSYWIKHWKSGCPS